MNKASILINRARRALKPVTNESIELAKSILSQGPNSKKSKRSSNDPKLHLNRLLKRISNASEKLLPIANDVTSEGLKLWKTISKLMSV